MEMTTPTMSVAPLARANASPTDNVPLELPPTAPPELVSKFQDLMARVGTADAAAKGPTELSGVVAKAVDGELAKVNQLLDNVLAVSDGNMSLIELQALQMRNITQGAILSMTHQAYLGVISAGKGSVSSLMKNQ